MPLSIVYCLGISAGSLFASGTLIHYFQLESYQFPGYFRTIRRNLRRAFTPGLLMTVSQLLLLILCRAVFGETAASVILSAAAFCGCGVLVSRALSEKKAKKPLVFTPRIKRLFAVSFLLLFLLLLLSASSVRPFESISGISGLSAGGWFILLFPLLLPLWIALCGLVAWPFEKLISELYFRDAQRILKSREDLIRIGITGSWGKTSVKFILGTMLEEKYHTLITPASYNTPMGVTKVIRSSLEPGHRVFVSEMGARHVGDIREMCRLVHPQLGLLTSVGPQHLDTFRTVERVARTKYELIEALPQDGTAFFADDGAICRKLYQQTKTDKMISGLIPGETDVWAEDISFSSEGSTFCICTADRKFSCSTSLLGELNIRNILLCASVCLKLGLTPEEISRGISKIRPVEHRLQLVANPGGMTVIDDAFNSNILGAEQALRVLREMKGKRILVTPGMVELGEQEAKMNGLLGEKAASCCDEAVLIGRKRSAAIAEGLKKQHFPEEHIHVVGSLEEAAGWIRENAGAGDTVLFENDLPDNYTE